ncbi:MAG: apolipoprotein N-acyltransferase [Zoogloeaceae bacterium]|nr:apolipoprotein N-acyltransferase [Zoogloeaceae bacterium]
MKSLAVLTAGWRRLERHAAAAPFLAFFLGALTTCAFAPLGLFWLTPLTLAFLFRLLVAAPGGWHALLRAWLFGMGVFLAGVSWVFNSIHIFGGLSVPLAAVPTFLLCFILASGHLFFGIFRYHLPASPWRQALFFAAIYAAIDLGRGWLFTGFPWLALGFSQTPPSPFSGYAPIFGVYGLSFFVAFCAALLTLGSRVQPRFWFVALAILVIGAGLRQIQWTHPVGAPISVTLIQSNIGQDQKWQPENYPETLRFYRQQIEANPAQLTVLPETALPVFYDTLPPAYLNLLETLARREAGDLLLGVPLRSKTQFWNGAVSRGVSPSQRYAKSHLVPFGEYVPEGFRWFMGLVNIPMVGFTPGSLRQPPLAIAGQQIAVNICYEDLFGQGLLPPLPRATMMVNLSNTAWFGQRSLAQDQHLQIARMRALETGRPMLRATNTGMTAVIRPDGQVQSVLPPFTHGVLTGRVAGYQGMTPYIFWGDIPIAFFLLALMLWLQWREVAQGSRSAGNQHPEQPAHGQQRFPCSAVLPP